MSRRPEGKLALPELAELKREGTKIVMVTAYDAPGARFAEDAGVDVVLVGDTAAMVVLGYEGTTVPVTMDEMLFLTRTVVRAARRPIVVGDMPFGSYQVSDEAAVENAIRFFKEAGADAVKLEGAGPSLSRVRAIVAGRDPGDGPRRPDAAVGDDARRVQDAGQDRGGRGAARRGRARARGGRLLRRRARGGSGAGRGGDHAPALRADDRHRRRPRLRRPGARLPRPARADRGPPARFVKRYASLSREIRDALENYAEEVRSGAFPEEQHSYQMPAEELELREQDRSPSASRTSAQATKASSTPANAHRRHPGRSRRCERHPRRRRPAEPASRGRARARPARPRRRAGAAPGVADPAACPGQPWRRRRRSRGRSA